jgi:hypothetical protein
MLERIFKRGKNQTLKMMHLFNKQATRHAIEAHNK